MNPTTILGVALTAGLLFTLGACSTVQRAAVRELQTQIEEFNDAEAETLMKGTCLIRNGSRMRMSNAKREAVDALGALVCQ